MVSVCIVVCYYFTPTMKGLEQSKHVETFSYYALYKPKIYNTYINYMFETQELTENHQRCYKKILAFYHL